MSVDPKKLLEAVSAAAERPERPGQITQPDPVDTPSAALERTRQRRRRIAQPPPPPPAPPLQETKPLSSRRRRSDEPERAGTASPHARPSRQGKKSITGVFPAEVGKQLRLLALRRDMTSQALLIEALRDLISKCSDAPPATASTRANRTPRDGQQDTVKVSVWVPDKARKRLHHLAILHDSSIQALLGEAINDLFEKHRVAAVAPMPS